MSRHTLQLQARLCHLCDSMIARKLRPRQPIRSQKCSKTIGLLPSVVQAYSSRRTVLGPEMQTTKSAPVPLAPKTLYPEQRPGPTSKRDVDLAYQELTVACERLLSLKTIPSEQEVTQLLTTCEELSRLLVIEPTSVASERKDSTASALLSLDDSTPRETPYTIPPSNIRRMQDGLSELTHSIITHPPVFITPEALKLYVTIHASLKRPETLPEVFNLYANKPLPKENSSPIQYSEPNPNKISNAISKPVADLALQTAIDARNLVAAMDIIEFSYDTKAFRRDKFVRYGLLPTTGLAASPFAAYALASQLASFQTTMETGMATNVAFAGMLAYVGFTSMIGIVAITTANDQMDRVTWAPGIPLRQRWIREEERAAIDKVSGAWGFREVWRRGEEEGPEWDTLREWIGLKGMILDRTELMEGME